LDHLIELAFGLATVVLLLLFCFEFRIPVPDLRSASDLEKKPWWRRSIHEECLQIDVCGFELKTTLVPSTHPTSSSYDIGFKKAKGLFW